MALIESHDVSVARYLVKRIQDLEAQVDTLQKALNNANRWVNEYEAERLGKLGVFDNAKVILSP